MSWGGPLIVLPDNANFLIANGSHCVINFESREHEEELHLSGFTTHTWEWSDRKNKLLFRENFPGLIQLVHEVLTREEASEHIIFFSKKLNPYPLTVMAAFFMYRFRWSPQKSVEYVQFHIPSKIDFSPSIMEQLHQLDVWLNSPLSTIVNALERIDENVEVLVRNTYLNGHYVRAPEEDHTENLKPPVVKRTPKNKRTKRLCEEHVMKFQPSRLRWNGSEIGDQTNKQRRISIAMPLSPSRSNKPSPIQEQLLSPKVEDSLQVMQENQQ